MTSQPPPNITLHDTPTASPALLSALTSHLPFSLPVFRRIQFANNFPRGSTPSTHILHAFSSNQEPQHFAAAYLDLSRHPETQCWFYSTLEDHHPDPSAPISPPPSPPSNETIAHSDALILALLRRINTISMSPDINLPKPETDPTTGKILNLQAGGQQTVLIGSLHEAVRQRMLTSLNIPMSKTKNVSPDLPWEFCHKWLFRVKYFPPTSTSHKFDKARTEDMSLIRSRTAIYRSEDTLLRLPSSVIRSENGEPIGWAFMALDGTLMSLHVEEGYRRRGLAKVIACRVMRDHIGDYGEDGWGAADVFVSNEKSRGVCRSIGGRVWWTLSWGILDLSGLEGEELEGDEEGGI